MPDTPTRKEQLTAITVLAVDALDTADLDAAKTQNLGNSLLNLVPKMQRDALKRKLELSKRSDRPKEEAIAAVREILGTIATQGNAISNDDLATLKRNMTTWMGDAFPSDEALDAKIADEVKKRSTPTVTADARTDGTPEQQIKAINAVVSKRLKEKMDRGELNPERLAFTVHARTYKLPFIKPVIDEKIAEAERYTDPKAKLALIAQALQEGLQLAENNGRQLTQDNINDIKEMLTPAWPTELFRDEMELNELVRREIASPSRTTYEVPKIPDGAVPAKNPAEEIKALNAIIARKLDDNLTAKSVATKDITNMASLLSWRLLSSEESSRYSEMLVAADTITNEDDKRKAVTHITREIIQKITDNGNFTYSAANILREEIVHGKLFANKNAVNAALNAEYRNPTEMLPAPPALPGGAWKSKLTEPPAETNDALRVAKAVRDLKNGPIRPGGSFDLRKKTPTGTWDEAKGKYIVKYTFLGWRDIPETDPDPEKVLATDFKEMSKERKDAIRRSMAEVSNVANIEFVEITDPVDVKDADIKFAQGDFSVSDRFGKSYAGYASTEPGGKRHLVVRNDTKAEDLLPGQPGQATLTHELLHTLGISHPGAAEDKVIEGREGEAGGRNKEYTKRGTVMSYNFVPDSISGMGPYDIAVLQDIYGASKTTPTDKTFTLEELTTTSTVYTKGKATLDLRHPAFTGKVKVDMSSKLVYPITGMIEGPKGRLPFDPRIAIGTDYEILMDNNSRIAIDIRGRKEAKLRGGRMGDTLTAVGGNNELTGNMGRDTFVLTTESGRDNVITDFKAADGDMILIRPGASEVRLEYVDKGGPGGAKGTYIRVFQPGSDEHVSSIFVKDATVDTVKANMVTMISDKFKAPAITAGKATDPTVEKRNKEYLEKLEEALELGKQLGAKPEIMTLESEGVKKQYITYTIKPANPDLIRKLGDAINKTLNDTKGKTGMDSSQLLFANDTEGTLLAFPIDEIAKRDRDNKFFEKLLKAKTELQGAVKTAVEDSKKPKAPPKKMTAEDYARELSVILDTEVKLNATKDSLVMDAGGKDKNTALKDKLVPLIRKAGIPTGTLLSVTADGKLAFDPARIQAFDAINGGDGKFMERLRSRAIQKELRAAVKTTIEGPKPKDPKIERYERYAIDLTDVMGADVSLNTTGDILALDLSKKTKSMGMLEKQALKDKIVAVIKKAGVPNAQDIVSMGLDDTLRFDPARIDAFDAANGGPGAFMKKLNDPDIKREMQTLINEEPKTKQLPPVKKPGEEPKRRPDEPLTPPAEPPSGSKTPAYTPPGGGSAIGKAFSSVMEYIGTGTAAGAAVGGLGALVLSFFMRGRDGEGPGFLSTLLMTVAGALFGGLAGGFINKDGPLFGDKKKTDDGTPIVKRPFDVADAPPSNQVVALESEQLRQSMGIPPGKPFRLLVKAGEVTDTNARFTGMYSSDGNRFLAFNKPIDMPVKDGKIDYTTVAFLSTMRLAEQSSKGAAYVKLNDLNGLIDKYKGKTLSIQEQGQLRAELILSTLGKDGKISKELAEEIASNAVNPDNTLNVAFLQANKDKLGLDQKRAVIGSPNGDNLNFAFGTLAPNEGSITIDQTITVDIKKAGTGRDGKLTKLMETMRAPEKTASSGGFDLGLLGALGDLSDAGITYRKAATPQTIGTLRASSGNQPGGVDMAEFNRAVEVINRGPVPDVSLSPVAPILAGMSMLSKPRAETR